MVAGDEIVLLAQQLEVFGTLKRAQQFFLLGLKGLQVVLHVLCGGLVAIGQHVLQPCDPQVGQRAVELRDIGHPVTAVNQCPQAEPIADCHQAGEGQNQAEAQGQFQVDADVAQPTVHFNLQERCAQDLFSLEGFVFLAQQNTCVELYRRR